MLWTILPGGPDFPGDPAHVCVEEGHGKNACTVYWMIYIGSLLGIANKPGCSGHPTVVMIKDSD